MESCKLEGGAEVSNEVNGAFIELFEQLSVQNDRLRNVTNLLGSKVVTLLGQVAQDDKEKTDPPKPSCWLYLMDNELRIERNLIAELENLVERL
jgi:hypothetical protein